MLWPQRLGSPQLAVAACIVIALPTIVFLQIPRDQQLSSKLATFPQSTLSPQLSLQDNSSLTEQIDLNGEPLYDNALEGGPRIRQASMLFRGGEEGEDAIYERAMRTHLLHGKRWGYPSHILRKDVVGKGEWKVVVYGKLLYLLSLIVQEMSRPYGKRAEWIVWFNAGTIVLNQKIPWEAFLPPSDGFPEVNFVGIKDWNGFNGAFFFLRVNEWSVNFLTEASALPLLRPDVKLGVDAPNYEQDAMVWVLNKEGYREHVIYEPRVWHFFYQEGEDHVSEHQRGDTSIHLSREKHAAIAKWLDKVEQSPEELQMPISNMTLKTDIAHFWNRLNNVKVLLGKASELQSKDKIKEMLIHRPRVGEKLKDATHRLQKAYQETPHDGDGLRKAYAELSDAIRATKEAWRQARGTRMALLRALQTTLAQTEARKRYGGERNISRVKTTNDQAEKMTDLRR